MKTAPALLSALTAALVLSSAGANAQTLSLSIEEGLVTLDARDVSLRQILERWADVGKVTLINEGLVSAAPITLQLSKVPERAALDTLLRSMSGYVLGQRPAGAAGTRIDRIMVLPVSEGLRGNGASTQQAVSPPLRMDLVAEQAPPNPQVLEVGGRAPLETDRPQPAGSANMFAPGNATAPFDAGTAVAAGSQRPAPQVPPELLVPVQDESVETGTPRPLTVPLFDPPAETPGVGKAPGNPFGVTSGADAPGTIVPARPKNP